MQEFWFCEVCKSMNRANMRQCYRCHAPKQTATMATVQQRPRGTVLTPGVDDQDRQVAWGLMARHNYRSAWALGYVSAVLLAAAGIGMVGALGLAVFTLVRNLRTGTLPGLGDAGYLIPVVAGVALVLVVAAIVVHSVFLSMTTQAAPGLGSGSPKFDPVRAGLWWVESTLWAIRAGIAFVAPPFLALVAIGLGGIMFGLIVGGMWFLLAYWLFGDPITCLGKPRRLLQDLYDRLAVPGSPDSRIVSWWAASWGAARGIEYAVAAFIYVAILVVLAVSFVGFFLGIGFEPASAEERTTAFVALSLIVGGIQIVCDAVAWCLLIQITLELARRQHIREKWVLSGLPPSQPMPNAPADQPPPPGPTAPTPGPTTSTPGLPAAAPPPQVGPGERPMPRYGVPRYPPPGAGHSGSGEE